MRRTEERRKNLSAFRLGFARVNGALDDPTFGQDHKSADLTVTFDDFNIQMRQNFCQRFGRFWSFISAVGDQLLQKRERCSFSKTLCAPPSRSLMSAG